uniref:ATP binding cassette subfamily A member 12 n=1 Tax=Cynoglossus semilaevis TaxID=244447 RepID=A0A3P8W266_CYNSE
QVWSLTLIIWPLIIFIIIAVTRRQFPPIVKETCYVGPRNLPSTGFFPFLQTLMCNTDSNCHSKSRLWDSSTQPSSQGSSPLADLIQGRSAIPLNFTEDLGYDPKDLLKMLENIMGMLCLTLRGNLNSLLTSVTFLKKAVCTTLLSFMNLTSPNPVSHSLVMFCQSNSTALEVTLNVLNQVRVYILMMTNPDEMVTAAGATLMLIEHLQNETTLWETLLTVPQLFYNGSVDQALLNTEVLLSNIQGAVHFFQTNFPETGQNLSSVNPLLAGGINVVRYFLHWPGKNETVSLQDIITVENSSIAQMFFSVLPDVQIPLHKAMGLMLDRHIVRSHLCRNSSDMLVSAACSSGTLDTLLSWISPDKLAKQVLLVWSKRVASHDVAFFKGLVHSLIGSFSGDYGESNLSRKRRAADVSNSGYSSCEDVLRPFEWIFATESINIDMWRNLFCQYSYASEQGQGLVEAFKGQAELNVTLPMILSEWHKLCNSSMQFGVFIETLAGFLGGAYWMDWMPVNNTHHLSGTALQRSFKKGTAEVIERSSFWPSAKPYFHALYWILNYRPSGMYTTANSVSGYMASLMRHLELFVTVIAMQPDSTISDPDFLALHIGGLFSSAGLGPIGALIFSETPVNFSTVLDTATKLGRQRQHLINFNETDPTLPELERLIMRFLSMEGNLSLAIPHIMGYSLLTYSNYFDPESVANFSSLIRPFTNKTSNGVIEAILSAMELLKNVIDSPNGDPTEIIKSYVTQLQELIMSMYRLRQINQVSLPSGQLSAEQVTDLHLLSKQFFSLLTPEFLQNLTQAGPEKAQNVTIQKFIALLPSEVQEDAARFFQYFRALQREMAQIPAGFDISAKFSEIFTFIDQIMEMMLSANGTVIMTVATPNSLVQAQEYEELSTTVFSLLLARKDAAAVKTSRQILHLIRLLMNTQNISVSDVENALRQSNLTLEELNDFAALAGVANIAELLANTMSVVNLYQCFEPQHNETVPAECVKTLVFRLYQFLLAIPDLQGQATILSLTQQIINTTFTQVLQTNYSSYPSIQVSETLNSSLQQIKLVLQENDLDTPEIMKEIKVLERVVQLMASTDPLMYLNNVTMQNPTQAQMAYLQIVQWYLNKLENITSNSTLSDLVPQLMYMTQMQVALQLSQTNFSLFVQNQIEHLIRSLSYPIEEEGIRKIGQTAIKILESLMDNIIMNINTVGSEHMLNTTHLNAVESQIRHYLDLLQNWMEHPNVTLLLSNMLQWGNPPYDAISPLTDTEHLLQTMRHFFTDQELVYVSAISSIVQSVKKALVVVQETGHFQSDYFLANIMEAIQTLQTLIPMPPPVLQNIMEIVHGSLRFIFQRNMTFSSSLNTTLLILSRTESLIYQTIPQEVAPYLISVVRLVATYFETIAVSGGPETLNQLILNEMRTLLSLLPQNSTAQAYISVAINITESILNSGQVLECISFMLNSMLTISSCLVQLAVASLMNDVLQAMNNTHMNASVVMEGIQRSVEQTMQAVQQSNGTLDCSEALQIWEPVRIAVGLSNATMSAWCNVELQPVAENYAALLSVQLQLPHMGVEPTTVNATAARIMVALQSLCQAALSQTQGTKNLIRTVSEGLFLMTGQRVSPEVEHHWYKQLQENMSIQPLGQRLISIRCKLPYLWLRYSQSEVDRPHLQFSVINLMRVWLKTGKASTDSGLTMIHLNSISMLSAQLANEAPLLHPYMNAVEKVLVHLVKNAHLAKGNSSEDFFKQTAMIFLTSANMTSHDMMSMMLGNFSKLNESSITDMLRQIVTELTNQKVFGEDPMVYQAMEELLMSNETTLLIKKVLDLSTWLTSTPASGVDLLMQALPRIYDILRCALSIVNKVSAAMPADSELFEDLAGNIIEMLRQLVSTGAILPPMGHHYGMYMPEGASSNYTVRPRRRREAPVMQPSSPIDDFIDLFYIDYPALFEALSAPPSTGEVMETLHMFFANPDLSVVLKGSSAMHWGLDTSREETIDAALGVFSFLTLPGALEMSSMDLLVNAVERIPDDFPLASLLKNITRALANETQGDIRVQMCYMSLFQISPTDPEFKEKLEFLRRQICTLETKEQMQQLLLFLSIEPGQLCNTILPSLQGLLDLLVTNSSTLAEAMFQTFIGNPKTYSVQGNWSSVLTQNMGFNFSGLHSLNINVTSPELTVGMLLKNQTAFVMDVQRHMNFDLAALHLLMNTTLPNRNLEILSWFVSLHQCNSTAFMDMKPTDVVIFETFCSMCAQDWYTFTVLMSQHVNMKRVMYRLVLSEEVQSLVAAMLQMLKMITDMMSKIIPAINQLQTYLLSVDDLNLGASDEFRMKSSMSSHATFVTLSRALCSKGILALFGISKLTTASHSDPSVHSNQKREEMIERFKIPRNATPFCMNMYLDMVNTTGGAIAWAFLKPMLMGHILYTPDTPLTRDIMEKSNATLHDFANLRKNSEEWLESSNYIVNSAEILGQTLPMLQSSLSNSFVKNFIQMQTDIDVDKMKDTLSNFSNMTGLLEQNKYLLKQITTLSNLMVDLSSCIKFDRYRGYNSAEELNDAAQDLAKNRSLYASVIFKLPQEEESSKNRHTRSSAASSTSALPPKVKYTIRMHMDNVMRTDRVREPFFIKDPHIFAGLTMRYNRGFIYLQENIDRAIIETHAGEKVTEPAVQLQPFPYPCHLRDEYLEAITFVFPFMLMLAWVLFVADFVKKLVHERELRLHEYMKMMGVNPISHFFAWFIECAAYLVLTIIVLTLVMTYGKILPNSDGFLLFLYFCDYGLSVIAFSYLVSSFFDKTYIAGLSGSLVYILCFFPFIIVMALEANLSFSLKSFVSLFSPTCFSYASQYVSRYESQGEGIHWSNSYTSPIAGDTCSFGWLCWLILIDSILYFIIGAYVRMVFPGKYGIPYPWYFPFKSSFWADLCCIKPKTKKSKGLFFTNILQKNQPVFSNDKEKGQNTLSFQASEEFTELPVGVVVRGLSKIYGDRAAVQDLNISFREGHVTSLLGHNGAGKTTTMSLLTGLYAPSSGSIDVYGRDMQNNIDDIRKEMGVCMQYDVLFDHMTAKEHLLLYGQIKAPQWSQGVLREQVRAILEETGMYAHRHKRVGTLSGGMKRKLSISIAFIGGSRLVVLDEPTTGVDPCSRRSIWDIVIQRVSIFVFSDRTIIMSTHHLDEAEVLSDCIAFLEKGGLKSCGSPVYLKDKLGQGYKLTLTKKMKNSESKKVDSSDIKEFIQAHVPEARLKEAQGGDLVYSLPPFNSSNASSYRSLLTALDSNLDGLQLGGYGISDTTLEEVFLQLTREHLDDENTPLSISETISDTGSLDSFSSDQSDGYGDNIKLHSSSSLSGIALLWQQVVAILIKRFHHSRRDWKGLISQVLLPVVFVVFAMGLGSIKNDLWHYPEMELSPALYNIGPSYSFFSNKNPSSSRLADTMMSFPGIDNACLDKLCAETRAGWTSNGNSSKGFSICQCTSEEQVCGKDNYKPPHQTIPSSQVVFNLSGVNVEKYLVSTANDFIRNRYGGFEFGMQLPPDLQMDLLPVPKNRTLSKVWFNPEGHHTMPAYMNTLNNLILRSNLPDNKDPREYAISVSSHPYFGRADDEEVIVQGMLQILVAMCVMIGYSITTASFAIYEVNEHQSGAKMLQHIAGVSEPVYWIVNFFYDMVIYLIPVTLTICVIAAFQLSAFTERQNFGAVALLLVLFGFATFPWMYLLSGVFRNAEVAFITYVCINLFISINTIMSTTILHFLSQISVQSPELVKETFERLCHAFLIFPQFSFGNGLLHLARTNIEVQMLSGYGVDAYQNPFSGDGLGWMFLASFIEGVVLFTLRLLLNKYLIQKVRRLICARKNVPHVASEDMDEDVAAEHVRVSSGAASSDILQVHELTKVYQHLKKKVHAVKKLSVGIPAGECFGLLGVNGAGKTTTFKMLTGDISPTDGTAQIREWDGQMVDIMECRNKGVNIGYCPQEDALDSMLTGEEHLYFYARIRGISKREIHGVVNYLLKRLELNYHRHIITDSYSCGTRRKLSTALSLIGHPQILLLDEPSSGMDPRTKRHLWKIISEEVKGKCAVVLTSHSMEECEALCSRLAIMVKGQFRCLGSLQHIKNRFGSGFTVKMYLAEASCDAEAITGFMQCRFPSTYLKDRHATMLEYHVPLAPGGVADIFDQLESNKDALQIKHFSVSQTTLDEVFINFAMGKVGMDSIPIEDELVDFDSIHSSDT